MINQQQFVLFRLLFLHDSYFTLNYSVSSSETFKFHKIVDHTLIKIYNLNEPWKVNQF